LARPDKDELGEAMKFPRYGELLKIIGLRE
jgi:hypothetical protein